jgi:hypothetical protein
LATKRANPVNSTHRAGRDAGFEVLTANREGSDVIQATIVNQLLDADLAKFAGKCPIVTCNRNPDAR